MNRDTIKTYDPAIEFDHPEWLPPGRTYDCTGDTGRLMCTLDAGHAGDHAAHGSDGEMYARWSQRVIH